MREPAISPAGITYERAVLARWVRAHGSEPTTRRAMSAAQIVPNLLARAALEAWAKTERADAGRAVPPLASMHTRRGLRAARRVPRADLATPATFGPPPAAPAALASGVPFVFRHGEDADEAAAVQPALFDAACVFAAGAPRPPSTLRRRSVTRQPADTLPLEA